MSGDEAMWTSHLNDPRGAVVPNGRTSGHPAPLLSPPLATKAEPVCVVVSSVEAERVEWLWQGRIPLGKLAVLDGDPGLGKSTLALHVAAAVSTGRAIVAGEHAAPEAPVLLLSAEDGVADTIRPRLEAAGADLDRVVVMTEIDDGSGSCRPVTLPEDILHVEQVASRRGVKLVVIDPLMAFLGGSVDAHRDQDVRRALAPLTKMAERTGAAVLIVRHLRKSGGGGAVHAGGGSIGIIGAARAGLLVARDPDDPEVRVLAVSKSNLSREAPALRYRLVDSGSGVARVDWVSGPCAHRADELVAAAQARQPDEPGALDEACEFLRRILANGPVTSKELLATARAEGIAERTLKRAKQKVGATSRPHSKGAKTAWMVFLAHKAQMAQMAPFCEVQEREEEEREEEGQGGQQGQVCQQDQPGVAGPVDQARRG